MKHTLPLKKKTSLLVSLALFIFCNGFFYFWISTFHSAVPFSSFEYIYDANHYIQDTRISNGQFSLMNALAQYDSQWYLNIAEKGYPYHPDMIIKENPKIMDGLLYNFFPLYPTLIALVNMLYQNVLLSAFIVSLLLLAGIFFSLHYVVSDMFDETIATKTIFLLFLYPFSIFLHGYYSESVRLLLFIWICYFITKKYVLFAAISVGLLCITSGISLLLLPFFLGLLGFYYYKKKITLDKGLLYALIALLPICLWMLFCYFQTGDPIFFFKTRYAWDRPETLPLIHNLGLIFNFPWLPLRSFYGSQMDVLVMVITIALAFLSRTVLPKVVWLMTCVLACTPLLLQDSVSLGRFSIVLFPFFVYMAVVMNKKLYTLVLLLFTLGLMVISLYFINWFWVE